MDEQFLKKHQKRIKRLKARVKSSRVTVHNMRPYEDFLYSLGKFWKFGEKITILEIGVGYGQSTNAFLKGLKDRVEPIDGIENDGILYSIDIKKKHQRSVKDEELKKRWVFIHGDSKEVGWDKPIDILFIDGSHTYENCRADYKKYEPFVLEKGLILLHDVLYPQMGVYKAWNEIKYPKFILSMNRPGLGLVTKE